MQPSLWLNNMQPSLWLNNMQPSLLLNNMQPSLRITCNHLFYWITCNHLFYGITCNHLFYWITCNHLFYWITCNHLFYWIMIIQLSLLRHVCVYAFVRLSYDEGGLYIHASSCTVHVTISCSVTQIPFYSKTSPKQERKICDGGLKALTHVCGFKGPVSRNTYNHHSAHGPTAWHGHGHG